MNTTTGTILASASAKLYLSGAEEKPGRYVPPGRKGVAWERKKEPAAQAAPQDSGASARSWRSNASNLTSWRSRRDSSASNSSELGTSGSSRDSSALSTPSSSPPKKTFLAGNWRESQYQLQAPKVCSPHRGEVYLLPVEAQVTPNSVIRARTAARGDQPWDHPLVVLETRPESKMAKCRLLTSFGNCKDIAAKKKPHECAKIALCDNDEGIEAHEGTRILTVKPGSAKFPKATYVNFHEDKKGNPEHRDGAFWIEFENLRTWTTSGRGPITFDEESVWRLENSTRAQNLTCGNPKDAVTQRMRQAKCENSQYPGKRAMKCRSGISKWYFSARIDF
ncbi:hypothetical protein BU23DRAFT_575276 [Bimuria novae-zelandiae CBS 107.79]|uniref:Uncharacterized protein n=1 Tax=Bimuria novae-zelandiae CBS 107.79 TaxID=1447943 RepID=A0A6A5UJW7_9PLEO|nr:hypothetical protein BU23DRAFT_575276 [Bimuria novae-zelandiae CBS 107.79]